jgi:hypothetical protein
MQNPGYAARTIRIRFEQRIIVHRRRAGVQSDDHSVNLGGLYSTMLSGREAVP